MDGGTELLLQVANANRGSVEGVNGQSRLAYKRAGFAIQL
jgi:hypothetical protein